MWQVHFGFFFLLLFFLFIQKKKNKSFGVLGVLTKKSDSNKRSLLVHKSFSTFPSVSLSRKKVCLMICANSAVLFLFLFCVFQIFFSRGFDVSCWFFFYCGWTPQEGIGKTTTNNKCAKQNPFPHFAFVVFFPPPHCGCEVTRTLIFRKKSR